MPNQSEDFFARADLRFVMEEGGGDSCDALGEGESGLPQAVCSITGGAATARERNRRLRRAHATLGPLRGPTSSSRSEIADFAKYKREFFEKYIDLSNGLPTDDTLRRFFQNLNPKSFRARFAEWASSIVHDSVRGKAVKAKRPSRNQLARSCGSPEHECRM